MNAKLQHFGPKFVNEVANFPRGHTQIERGGPHMQAAPPQNNHIDAMCSLRVCAPITYTASASLAARSAAANASITSASWSPKSTPLYGGVVADTVIGHAVLRQVVRADLLRAVTVADLRGTLCAQLGLLLSSSISYRRARNICMQTSRFWI